MRRISPGLGLSLVLSVVACQVPSVEVASPKVETLPVAAAASSVPAGDDAADDDAGAAIKETIDLSKADWIELEASPGAAALVPGAEAIRQKKWSEARKSLEAALAGMQGAPIDQRFAGLALLGRSCDFLKDRKAAENAYNGVLDAWRGESTVREAIAAAGSDETARRESVQRVLLAVGEALYFIAEQKRDSADELGAPGYTGTPTKANLEKFISERVDPWVSKKQLLLAEVEGAYAKVAALEPAPPPRLLVRSAARVGLMRAPIIACGPS